ncbi:putative E3 ubiquitin-protein ligase XBAT31 [Lotus japonicus]|uniref:putative E3 ubiquitin-protein ligase XBAT31 n=1 Tax=Lotus japonicus TaxID=34305 RepID=UPI00258D49BB|nr:putative E3 ubiquitin-protein ligase XBAT31 [Lotus japonicus]
MGQGLSCRGSHEHGLFRAVQHGDLQTVSTLLQTHPALMHRTTVYDHHSALHIAAANGQIQVLSRLLDGSANPDVLNRQKQTPLMLAAMHGKIACVEKLLEAGANVLMFDAGYGRTCLHYSAYYGHSSCLKAILSAAQSSPVAASWGFARFVNVRDARGATPLHLAARQRRPECVHILLCNGALVGASTGRYGCPGSTPLHLAAKGGSLDCIRELLAWGADRLQRDASGRIPYVVALKHRHSACAALLNLTAAQPLVWPSSLKIISDLNPDAKVLLERALMDANREREKKIFKESAYSLPSPSHSDQIDDNISEVSETELCCICFEQVCTIEVQECGHQMCAKCTLALCCHNKPNPSTSCPIPPICPFCRSTIARLVVIKIESHDDIDQDGCVDISCSNPSKSWKFRNLNEGGSSSFKGLSSSVNSFGKMGCRSSGRVEVEDEWVDNKPQ